MKTIFTALFIVGAACSFAAPRPVDKPFTWPTDLKYTFLPKQKITFIDGVVKNPGRSAYPDADAQYSRKVRVDNWIFTLPGELCETMAACYKADLNGDKIPDYVFVSVKVGNGRFAGLSDVGIFVSNPQKNYTFNAFEARHLEAEIIKGKVMLVKYAFSDDDETYIRQFYTFNAEGRIRLHKAEEFSFRYKTTGH